MGGMATGRRAAEQLMHDKDALARAVTARLYAEKPSLLEKHGERGREKCLQDMFYNIEHLVPAVDLEDAPMFSKYVQWLVDMLGSRGVASDDVTRCLELLTEEASARLGDAEGRLVADVLAAGISVSKGKP